MYANYSTSEAIPPQTNMKRTASCSSLVNDGDAHALERDRLVYDGHMSDTEYVFDEDHQSASTSSDSEAASDEERRQDQHQQTGLHVYTSACARLGIAPASNIISRLSSDRLNLRHALLNPASAAALSAGLSLNRCIRSLNLGSNLLGDDSARTLLEAFSDKPSLTKLDLSRNQLSDRSGELLAQNLSSPLCALRDLVLADNFFSDRFTDVLSKGMRNLRTLSVSPLRNLDVSNNKICDRNGKTLASVLCSCSIFSLNLSWNDLRESETVKNERDGDTIYSPLARAALVHPGRLVSLELSFNGLPDAFGGVIGGMLADNTSLAVLDLSRNHLGKSSALRIADGLKSNRSLTALKLGWNALGREGTLGIIRAIGDNRGSLKVVRLENTTDAGLEFEAAREAESAIACRAQWVEVVCEYPDRARTKGNSHAGPISWMTEHAPDAESNTTYKTRQEQEQDKQSDRMGSFSTTAAPPATSTRPGGDRTKATGASRPASKHPGAPLPTGPAPSSRSPRTGHIGTNRGATAAAAAAAAAAVDEEEQLPRSSILGPAKEAVAVPVLSVRLKLRAREEARLEAEKLAALEQAAAETEQQKKTTTISFLRPLNKAVREKTLAEPPPRLLMLRKARAKSTTYKRGVGAESGRTASRGRSGTPPGLSRTRKNNSAARGHSRSSQSVPGYMRRISRRSGGRTKSTGQSRLGRSKNGGNGLWASGNSTTDQRPQTEKRRSPRRTARGRSSSAGRSRGGANRSYLGHRRVDKSSSGRTRRNNARRTIASSSPGRSTWPAMTTIVQAVAPPSRLKLRGTQQEDRCST